MSNTAHPTPSREPPSRAPLTLDDLLTLGAPALRAIMDAARPLDLDDLAGRVYLGVDLSLPKPLTLLWKTFRKTFYRDPTTGAVRGWNVRMEQTGVGGARVPKRGRDGAPITFGHYVVRDGATLRWPSGYQCAHYLDYGVAGNARTDPARFACTPLVAVNEGSSALLLGWEIMRVGPRLMPLPLYWALQADGPLDGVVEPPRRPQV